MTDPSLDMAPCGIFSFTDSGKLTYINEAASSFLGYDRTEVPGQNVESIFTVATRIFFQTHLFPLVRMHGHAEEIYITLKTVAGTELPVLLNAKRISSADPVVTTCAFIVVHNRKKFEEELIAARKSAEKALQENTDLSRVKAELQEHAEKLEEQMQMIGHHNQEMLQLNHAVTHNLKEPLRKVMLFAGKLQGITDSPDLEKLIRSAEQMKLVVTALQEYVWLDEKVSRFALLDLADLVRGVATRLKNEHPSVRLDLVIEELPRISGDAEQLRLLFYHILANAIRFRKQEQVFVTITSTLLKRNLFRNVGGKYTYVDFIRLEIVDKGKGFDPKYREAVFELFRKLHFDDGQGMGLAVAKKVVQNHGGYIEAESEPGKFTRLIIYLPMKHIGSGGFSFPQRAEKTL